MSPSMARELNLSLPSDLRNSKVWPQSSPTVEELTNLKLQIIAHMLYATPTLNWLKALSSYAKDLNYVLQTNVT